MHISEGILSGPVLIAGAALAAAGCAKGLKELSHDHIPRAGMLSAAFFVAALIHVPLGPVSVHLILNGIVGLLLGWAAFPVILTALLLQAMLFQFGGFTALGVNTLIMALPALACYYAFSPFIKKTSALAAAAAFGCGFCSILLGSLLTAAALMFTEKDFLEVSYLVVGAHLPVMIIEGFITVFFVAFIKKVQPSLLSGETYAGMNS